MKILFLVLFIPFVVSAQSGTEIYLLQISKTAAGFDAKSPINITQREGYDNQPSFHPSKTLIYFSSQSNGQTDIWYYDYVSKKLSQITNTEDSEYSPTVTPDQKNISCIVQRKSNSDQDLVKFLIENPEKTDIILESQKAGKIGYHAWSPKSELACFVLGEPNTFQFFEKNSKSGKTLAKNIGRSLHFVPSKGSFSFVETENEISKVKLLDTKTGKISVYADALPDSELYNAWNENGVLFGTKNNEVYFFDEKNQKWESINLPKELPKNKISRLAIKGQYLALVINE
jgi:tricorn protease-like protein